MANKQRFIDLTAPITNDSPDKINRMEIVYSSHEEGARTIGASFGLASTDFPDGCFAAVETVTLSTHSGTHLDAPWHFGPKSEGLPSKTIDQIPLEWCFSDGVVLDLTHKTAGEEITAKDVQGALAKINYHLKPLDIVLIRTDTSKRYNEENYENLHPGMTREATPWLIGQGVKVMGIDGWGWDRPLDLMVSEYKQTGENHVWEAHFVGREREYCHIEKLANLDQIPRPYGFKVAVFPIKVMKASAGWVRAVAIVE